MTPIKPKLALIFEGSDETCVRLVNYNIGRTITFNEDNFLSQYHGANITEGGFSKDVMKLRDLTKPVWETTTGETAAVRSS